MSRPKVYIDGESGTTGLQIYERLGDRRDIELLRIDPDRRRDPVERKRLMDEAELVFLCLPDDAAREAAAMLEGSDTRIIDCSTAHRTAPGWVYGFPELHPGQREAIAGARRVANPGCHATGFISIVAPLVAAGVLPADVPLTCFSLTGYSGGWKKMIAQYEVPDRPPHLSTPGIYGVTQAHKHLPEMQQICGLAAPPVFCPIVDDYYKGMATTVPLHIDQLIGVTTLHQVWQALADHYAGEKMVRVAPEGAGDLGGKLYGNAKAGDNDLTLVVMGNDEAFTITALFDNLGKGASGSAVQNMNIMLGLEETTGLLG